MRALEAKMKDIRAYIRGEKEAIPKARAVIESCKLQREHLDHIAAHLPTYLPSRSSPPPPVVLQDRGNGSNVNLELARPAELKKKLTEATGMVRRYITTEEFESISGYMRGRLTTDKVNAALDELTTRAEATTALVASARRGRPLGAERKHAMWLLHNIACHESLKGKTWALESDLKSGTALRLDKTGKTVLTLLRHLGRVSEVRVSADGTTHIAYALI